MVRIGLLLGVLIAMVTGCTSAPQPTIVLVAFGTSDAEARKTFAYIDAAAHKQYPGAEIRWAFTSQFIIKKLRQQGVAAHSLEETVAALRRDGLRKAVFQSLHIVPGQEFNELHKVEADALEIAVGAPLLASDADIAAVVKALEQVVVPSAANVVVAHGNKRHPEFNQRLVAFAKATEAAYPSLVVCSVEGQPGLTGLRAAKARAAQTGAVNFIPLMLIAGVHVRDDIMGGETDSWKSRIGATRTTCTPPLGRNDMVLSVFFAHLDEALASLRHSAE
jgi:sirohydrochlorin cobaltochelatase